MKTPTKGHNAFPFYLKQGYDHHSLKWLGKRLQTARGKKTTKMVAAAADVSRDEIAAIEKGIFHLGLGRLRRIIHLGYSATFADLLSECYEAHQEYFDPKETRPFDRDYHYSLYRRIEGTKNPTPLLVGGKPDSYLWAIPMRRLKKQPMVIEFLELAPVRKRNEVGTTPNNSHDGVEVIHVVHGTVQAHIAGGGESANIRRLKAGDSIHFDAARPHYIENVETNTCALLLIVRLPELEAYFE